MIKITMWLRNDPEVREMQEINPEDGFEDSYIGDALLEFCESHGIEYTPEAIARHMKYHVNYAA